MFWRYIQCLRLDLTLNMVTLIWLQIRILCPVPSLLLAQDLVFLSQLWLVLWCLLCGKRHLPLLSNFMQIVFTCSGFLQWLFVCYVPGGLQDLAFWQKGGRIPSAVCCSDGALLLPVFHAGCATASHFLEIKSPPHFFPVPTWWEHCMVFPLGWESQGKLGTVVFCTNSTSAAVHSFQGIILDLFTTKHPTITTQ